MGHRQMPVAPLFVTTGTVLFGRLSMGTVLFGRLSMGTVLFGTSPVNGDGSLWHIPYDSYK
jgi:hypothetical protein